MAAKVTTKDIAQELVKDVGGNPNNAAIVRAVEVWVTFESGSHILSNNPWNLRPGKDYTVAAVGVDNKNFTVFATWQDGVKATSQRLSKDDYRGYRPIYNAIRANSATGFFKALVASKWSSDHYGGGAKLLNAFKGSTNFNHTISFGSRGSTTPVNTSPGKGADDTTLPKSIPGTDSGAAFLQKLAALGISNNPTHVFTHAEAMTIASSLYGVSGDTAAQIAATYEGTSVQSWLTKLATGETVSVNKDPLTATADAISGLGASIIGTVTTVATYFVAVVFILAGIWLYSKSGSQGAPVG